MKKFIIVKNETDEYKDQIIKFWNDYLPGTPPERFDWMKNGNPAGPATWFLAFPKDSNELAGTISVMPKEMVLNHKKLRVGIVGDYMVDSKYRVFGPALQLIKTVTRSLNELDLESIYTIPNVKSEKIAKHVGFKDVGRIYYLGKHLRFDHYLEKYLSLYLAKFVGLFIEQIMKVLSRETYISSKGFFDEVTTIDESFDSLWQDIKEKQTEMIGNHNGDYISWRYLQNPHFKFKLLTYRKNRTSDLFGYIIFVVTDEKLNIYDIVAKDNIYADRLLKKLITNARRLGCRTVYITVFANNPWVKRVKRHLFWDSKYEMKLYCFGEKEYFSKSNMLFAGDRNE